MWPDLFNLLCRAAFLLCIGFNILLQALANALGEERIEIMVDALLKGGLSLAAFS